MAACLQGQRFVLVGNFSVYQYEVKDLIHEHGGEVLDFVPQHLAHQTIAVIGDRTGSSELNRKLEYLKRHGSKTMSEQQLADWIMGSIKREEVKAEERQIKMQDENYGAW